MTPTRRTVLASLGLTHLGLTRLGLTSLAATALRPGRATAEAPTLKALAARRGILFGAAAEPGPLIDDPAYGALIAEQCAVITTENALKWDAVEPVPGQFDFAPAERLAAFARQHGLALRGHGLIWHEALPPWVRGLSPAALGPVFERHIDRVVRQFQGRLVALDVVVEAVERNDQRADGLRRAPWIEALGPGYLPLAFAIAHQADPQLRLVLEDYGLEYDSVPWMVEKRATLLERLRQWRRAGVPIHGLGLQAHLRADYPPVFGQGLRDFLRAVADLGLKIEVTELDINDQFLAGSVAERDQRCADHLAAFLAIVLAEPAVDRVITWGLADRHSSINQFFTRPDGQPLRPLPYDDRLTPKPLRAALVRSFSKD